MSARHHTPVHVLHVLPWGGRGGMELTAARVITALSGDMRHSVACLRGEAPLAEHLPDTVDVHRLDARPRELGLPVRLAKLIRRLRPTVIHARNWGAWPDTVAARMLVRGAGPLIFSFHGMGGDAGWWGLRRQLTARALARMTAHVFALSDPSRQLLAQLLGRPVDRIGVIPNGVDTDRFRPARRRERRGRAVIGTVGHLRPVKNHAMLIRSCAALADRGEDIELRIAGHGDERGNLLLLAAELGFADHLDLAGRAADVPAFLNGLDAFVLSSDDEQHPNALAEALACGLPCVATRVGCVPDLLDAGRCGIIVEPGDADALTDALGGLLSDPERAAALGRAGADHVRRQYNAEKMAVSYRRMYEALSSGWCP